MKLIRLKPRKALNKAFLKVKPHRTEIENFKANLLQLIDRTNDFESEEFHKNLVIDFLKKTYYDPKNFVNTKGRNDLVIHNGENAKSSVGVIIEAKKPTNKSDMLSKSNINVKAFHELVLYYLRERISLKNLEIKYLIATNIYEWYIFDANVFEKLFAHNKDFVKQFTDFESGRLSGNSTDFFYKEIAQTYISSLTQLVEYTYFDIREYEKPLRNTDKKEDVKLVALFKLLSPEHLLKLPFANDSNSLDKRFYGELLHIIGLAETKEGSKKLIGRSKEGQRNTGSLLENAIIQLDSMDMISRLPNPSQYGANQQERLFNVGLELSITWINRILFLKLLEAQLISYHQGNKDYAFLSYDKIKNYDDLNSLFFQVLAQKEEERSAEIKSLFQRVPYLNSSLFEPQEIEHTTLFIGNLDHEKTIPIYASTVLKNEKGKKKKGNLYPIEYLFAFLEAYDFSSEGSEDIQEDNKALINASVLGLIFEKINGYKDGSFFTPGFITMYMSRETIRRAVVQKFNDAKGWDCKDIDSLYDKIEDRAEANTIINSLKIVDPAVGSGHFLVSALNEILAIKNDLKVLQDREGKRLKEYNVEVVNDDLIITDEDGELFEYHPKNKESQRVQEAFFHEKKNIIENCLFGVDININSVKICRLRLWIELLKNSYYKEDNQLETLPNIDINIKCGNSLISRFDLDADLGKALKKSKWDIGMYRVAVDAYRNAQNKEQKHQMENLISDIKGDFRSEISNNDPKVKKLKKLNGELFTLTNQTHLFDRSKKEITAWNAEVKKLSDQTIKLEQEIEDIKNNKIYENAFEWRFEFPEVLDDNGDFVGFDVVIGNPPYFSISTEPSLSNLQNIYKTFSSTGDIYALFIERSVDIVKTNAFSTLIISNKWMRANYGVTLRKYLVENTNPIELIDFGQNLLFESAIVHTNILTVQKQENRNELKAVRFPNDYFNSIVQDFKSFIKKETIQNLQVNADIWNVIDKQRENLKVKAEKIGKELKFWNIEFYRGVLTGYNEAFIIDEKSKKELIEKDAKSNELIKPILRGRDTRRFHCNYADLYMISTFPTLSLEINEYPSIKAFLSRYLPKLNQVGEEFINDSGIKEKTRKRTPNKWFETQDSIAYYREFAKSKIIFSEIVSEPQFYYDEEGFYPEATVFFISGKNLKYLTALLNSKAVTFLFKSFYMGGELVGKIRYKKAFLEKVPLPVPNEKDELIINEKVNQILILKKANPLSDTTSIESEIDQMVYKLYDLTEEEIAIIEESVK